MANDRAILDASALLLMLEDAPGADRVEHILRKEKAFIPWVALMEVHVVSRQSQDESEADLRFALLEQTDAILLTEMDEPTMLAASRFITSYGMNAAAAITAAYALTQRAVLICADPAYQVLKNEIHVEFLHKEETP